jgi:hypothetical protein
MLQKFSSSGWLTKKIMNLQSECPHTHNASKKGINVSRLHMKCAPVCPFENDNCCMACILSKQDDFANQISVVREAGHECIFRLKFHCELNPIEMVSHNFSSLLDIFPYLLH